MRLGLDIGTTSIGWMLYGQEGTTINRFIDGGVRLYSDGLAAKDQSSLAEKRRLPRGARRRRDRYLARRTALTRNLVEMGLLPDQPDQALQQTDIYATRAEALEQKLTPFLIGRIAMHLNRRRGFKSNRKVDNAGDNESGKIKDGAHNLQQMMIEMGVATYGAFHHQRTRQAKKSDQNRIPSVRARLHQVTKVVYGKSKISDEYAFYPTRVLIENEFDKIFAAQQKYYPDILTEENVKQLRDIIFHQRPLKAPKIGLCTLDNKEERLSKAHPITQQRILYETVNALHVQAVGEKSRPLNIGERDHIILALNNKKATARPVAPKLTFKSIKKLLKLSATEDFTLNTEARKELVGDATRGILSHPDAFGAQWLDFDITKQAEIVKMLKNEQDISEVLNSLQSDYGLSQTRAEFIANLSLPEGYSRLGLTASTKILARLKEGVVLYSDAAKACGYNHSNLSTGEVFDELPYYGAILENSISPGTGSETDIDEVRIGKIANATVHIGLNQLRKLVNAVIARYGKPQEIVIELARDLKLSQKQKKEIEKKQRDNKKSNDRRALELQELNLAVNGANLKRLRIWEQLSDDILSRRCIYSGRQIALADVFSAEFEVDHILPYSRTLDDAVSNLTLCARDANRTKGNKSPFEAWGADQKWGDILERVSFLPNSQQWRFNADAMQRFEEKRGGDDGWIARQLTDTQFIGRAALQYLNALYPNDIRQVWVITGQLTSMLRREWGLNSLLLSRNLMNDDGTPKKNRDDHRHHAIDAAVIAATDRGLLNRINRAAGRAMDEDRAKLVYGLEAPWPSFRNDMKQFLQNIVVSHRQDHGKLQDGATIGQLHDETARSLAIDQPDSKGNIFSVSKVSFLSLKPENISKIRDVHLRQKIQELSQGKSEKELKQALQDFAQSDPQFAGIRSVRILKPHKIRKIKDRYGNVELQNPLIPIKDKFGKIYKYFESGSNYCYDIWRMPNGDWEYVVRSMYEVHQSRNFDRPHPAAKLLMRLQQGDTVHVAKSKFGAFIGVVQKFDHSGKIVITPVCEANADKRYSQKGNSEKDDVYVRMSGGKKLKESGIRKIRVDILGRVYDRQRKQK